jgi:peptide deformylase
MKIALIGEQILKQIAKPVKNAEFSTKPLLTFIQQLKETMQQANGIGIAAPQVFDPRAIMIIASRPTSRYPQAPEMAPLVLINPSVKAQSDDNVLDWDGCLSVPGLRGEVLRSQWVEVQYVDASGEQKLQRFEGFLARIFLHEYDHLIGKTWLDHIKSTDNIMANDVWLDKVLDKKDS